MVRRERTLQGDETLNFTANKSSEHGLCVKVLKIGVFVRMQSNGDVYETRGWKTVERPQTSVLQ